MKNHSKQIKKEALITLGLYVFYFCWWYYFAYMFEDGDVENYTYILGLPGWFFYSCVLGLVVINILVYIAVKFFFKDIDLDEIDNQEKNNDNLENISKN